MKIPFPKTDKTILDSKYRYKRDIIIIEKASQFIILRNILTIAKDLDVDINTLIKYLQKKLCQPIIKSNELYKVKCTTTNTDIEKHIEQFIIDNLLCKKCNLPEIKDNKKCNACGNLFQ